MNQNGRWEMLQLPDPAMEPAPRRRKRELADLVRHGMAIGLRHELWKPSTASRPANSDLEPGGPAQNRLPLGSFVGNLGCPGHVLPKPTEGSRRLLSGALPLVQAQKGKPLLPATFRARASILDPEQLTVFFVPWDKRAQAVWLGNCGVSPPQRCQRTRYPWDGVK